MLHLNGTTLFAGARPVGPLWLGYVRPYTGQKVSVRTGLPRTERVDALAEVGKAGMQTRMVIIATLALTGCASVPPSSHTVLAATADQVAGCSYVADVHGMSEEEMAPRPGSNVDRARVYALAKAEEMGATHMVWEKRWMPAHGTAAIKGVAYRCR